MKKRKKKEIDMILFFTVALDGVHFTEMIKNGLSFMLETVLFMERVTNIDESEDLSGQILLLGRIEKCTG